MGEIASAIVKLGARDDGLSAALSKAGKETRGLISGISAAIPAVGSLNTAIGMGLAGGLIYATEKIASMTYQMAENGAVVERLTNSYNSLWQAAGIDSATALEKLRTASMGTISDQQLMLSANRALLFGFKATDDQLAELLQVAAFRGRAMGLSTQQAFNDIVTGIGRMSPLILDNLGIMIDADARWAEYAKTLGKSSTALTGAEKRQALMNAVIEDGNTQMRAAGGLAEDNATKFERYEASVTNLKNAIGELMAGPGGKLVDSLAAYLEYPTGAEWKMAEGTKSYEEFIEKWETWYRRRYMLEADAQLAPSEKPGLTEKNWQRIYDSERAASAEAARYKGWIDAAKSSTTKLANEWDTVREAMSLSAIFGDLDPIKDMQGSVKGAVGTIVDAIASGDIAEAYGNQLLTAYQGAAGNIAMQYKNGVISLFDYELEKAQIDAMLGELTAGIEKATDTSSSLRSAIDSVLAPTYAGNPTNVLDAMGLHIDTADEDARRLAAVMAGGLQNEWVSYFKDKGLLRPEDLVSEQAVQARAATLLDEFNKGLRPELINKETAKERVKELLIGQQNMDAIAKEIMTELQKEGFGGASINNVKAYLGDPTAAGKLIGEGISNGMGAATGTGLVSSVVTKITKDIDTQQAMIESAGKMFGKYFAGGMVSGVDYVGFMDRFMQTWAAYLTASGGGYSGAN